MDEKRLQHSSDAVLSYYMDPANHFRDSTILSVKKSLVIIKEPCTKAGCEIAPDMFDKLETSDLSKCVRFNVRHVCAMLAAVDENGKVRYVCAKPHISAIAPLNNEEFRQSLSAYSAYQLKLGMAKDTVHQKEIAIRDFFLYLESVNVTSLNQITREHLCYYCNAGLSSYKETTRAAIIYRIRKFVLRMILLGEIKDSTILNVFESGRRFPQKMVTVLTDEQRTEILTKKNPKTVSEAREIAAGLLCLVLGLRRSDAYGLTFNNIDWKNKRIHLFQKKTGYYLELPLPDIVGNALATYILRFRPESESGFIFLSLKAPYLPCKKPQHLVGHLLGFGNAPSDEMHILRRSCATNLMNQGIDPLTIMGILGQRTADSLNRYLVLKEDEMSQCSLDQSYIGLPEIMK